MLISFAPTDFPFANNSMLKGWLSHWHGSVAASILTIDFSPTLMTKTEFFSDHLPITSLVFSAGCHPENIHEDDSSFKLISDGASPKMVSKSLPFSAFSDFESLTSVFTGSRATPPQYDSVSGRTLKAINLSAQS